MLNFIQKIARLMAFLGGSMLAILIVMVCVSILGRSLNGVLHTDFIQEAIPILANGLLAAGVGPLNGDYELLEAGIAFSIFAFLPLCQLNAAHASVDIFTAMMPARFSRFMIWLSEFAFALVLILIAWQMTNGLMDKYLSGETTFLLQFPVWWAYGLSMIGAYVAGFIAVTMIYYRSRELLLGERIFSQSKEC